MNIDAINFLPPTHQGRHTRRQRLWRHAAMLLLLCACLGGWWMVQREHTQRLRDRADALRMQVEAARPKMQMVSELRREQAELNARLDLWRHLGQPVSHSEVFATLAAALPDTVVLTRLDVQSHRPAPTPAAAASGRRGATAPANAAAQPAAQRGRLELDFSGIAPDDMTLARLLNHLKRQPLFDEVKLHFSRNMTIHDVNGRQFRIELLVPLDRDYQRLPVKEGVAHVNG